MTQQSTFAVNRFLSEIIGFEESLRGLPVTSTPMHIEPQFIGFSYGREDLIAGLSDDTLSAVIHHGDLEAPADAAVIPMMTERLFVFAGKSRSSLVLTPTQLGDILIGRLTDWSQLGGKAGTINLIGHGRPVHLKSFLALIRLALGIESLSKMAMLKSTYEDVAACACRDEDSLSFGLRWSHVAATPLMPLTVLSAAQMQGLPISLVLRRELMLDPSRRDHVRSYLEAVRARLAADAAGFGHISDRSQMGRVAA